MSDRLVVALFALVVTIGGVIVSVPSASAESSPACFKGVFTSTDDTGQIIGSSCADVIVADERTTSIDGGTGDDVIIGAPNTVFVNGGDGWDYIVGNSYGAILKGGSGNDTLDAGRVPLLSELAPNAKELIEQAASDLPADEASDFRDAVAEELRKAHDAAQTESQLDLSLRQEVIRTDPRVREVVGTPGRPDGQDDGSLDLNIEALHLETERSQAVITAKLQELEEAGGVPMTIASRDWEHEPVYGNADANIIYGGRGTDEIYGADGDDLIFGGIEDDKLHGNGGNDYLLGGFGSDYIYGGPGNDVVQGDATGDKMEDGAGVDTLSFASGGANGFSDPSMSGFPNFPATNSSERGIYVNLAAGTADNGSVKRGGGGTDKADTPGDPGTAFSDFERVIGTPFADYIVGTTGQNVMEGGGGSDVINGGGGSVPDVLIGGAGGDNLTAPPDSWLVGEAGEDYCGGSGTVLECELKPSNWVGSRDTTKISVGMTSPSWAGQWRSHLYMAGSTANWVNRNGEDDVVVTQLATTPPSFRFTTMASSLKGQFSTLPEDKTPGCSYTATQVICAPSTRVVTLDLSGFGSNDALSISNVAEITNPIFLGGQGHDTLSGGNYTDDFMHDGIDNDTIHGLSGDDGFVNTSGVDTIDGGVGDDLVESSSACEGDTLIGGNDLDSASWVQYRTGSVAGTESGVLASIYSGNVGRFEGGALTCEGEGPMNSIDQFEDLEGSRHRDELRGDSSSNQLIGRASNDKLKSYASQDRIIANSGDNDTIDCALPANPAPGGVFPGGDIAFVDKPGYGTDSVSGCENVTEALPVFPDS